MEWDSSKPRFMAKYHLLSNRLKIRIAQGDYALRALPAERQLAQENGVSYMTARRAVQTLIDEGVVVRGTNGRLEVNRDPATPHAPPAIALLSPAYHSPGYDRWRNCLSLAAREVNRNLKQILYTHWDDPLFTSPLDGFSGVFLLPSSERMPPQIVRHLSQSSAPLVVLDDDLSHVGLPSIRQFPPHCVDTMLDHLKTEGYREIDCLNVQPAHEIVELYIAGYQRWLRANRLKGRLINEPIEPYSEPLTSGYRVMKRLLEEGHFKAEALFCVTAPAALGAMRALHEAGIHPGQDVAICTLNGEGLAEFHIPSLTALEAPDIGGYIRNCLDWMLGGGGPWSGPLLLEPENLRLQARESTTRLREGGFVSSVGETIAAA